MSISTLAARNGLNGQTLRKQYKEVISDYRSWKQLGHAERYILFPGNMDAIKEFVKENGFDYDYYADGGITQNEDGFWQTPDAVSGATLDETPTYDADIAAFVEHERTELMGEFCRGCGYCMPYCPQEIMINQANGKLLTRLVKPSGNPNYEDFNSTNRVDDAQWHHYALVYDKSQGAFAVYLDYRLITSKTYVLTAETGAAFCFGGEGRSKQVFSGQLDDFRITRRAMKASEFLTTRQIVSAGTALFAHFEGDLSTGQDAALAPVGVGGTLGGGTAPTFVDVSRRIDLDVDGAEDYESTKALRLDGGSVVWPHNSLLECRDFTVEWFAKYDSIDDVAMLLRLGMMSNEGTGTISWALYTSGGNLRFGAYVSPDGSWKNIYRPDYNFATIEESGIADGKWHHLALVAETHPDATPANTTFTLYKDYERVGSPLVFNGKDGADGILAFPSTGTTLSIGTGGKKINGLIDELRFRPGVQPVSSFMRRLPNGLTLILK